MRKQPKISRMGKPRKGKPRQISLHSASEGKGQEPPWNPRGDRSIINPCCQNSACLTIQWLLQTTSLWNPPALLSLSKDDVSVSGKKRKAEWSFSFVLTFSSVGPGKTCYFAFLHLCSPVSACVLQNIVNSLLLPPPAVLVFFFPLILFFVFKHYQISLIFFLD